MTDGEQTGCAPQYSPEALARYFDRDSVGHLARISSSIAAADGFLREHGREALVGRRVKPAGYAHTLQFYKDETFLTLYAFVSLDLAGSAAHLPERERLFGALLEAALPGAGITVTGPQVTIEKQVPAPALYKDSLRAAYATEPESCHPVWYVRALGSGKPNLEGPTHADAMLTFAGDRKVMFEAKFLSDISASTTYAPERNQIARNLDAGLESVDFDLSRFWYVFVSPCRFKERPESRYYGYKLPEYMDAAGGERVLARDLPHLRGQVDFAELARHVGWVTWEDICELLAGSVTFCSDEYPHAAMREFFGQRCLWPGSAVEDA